MLLVAVNLISKLNIITQLKKIIPKHRFALQWHRFAISTV